MFRPSSMRYTARDSLVRGLLTRGLLTGPLTAGLLAMLAMAGCGGGSAPVEPGGLPIAAPAAGPDALRGKVFGAGAVTERGVPRELVAGTTIEVRFTEDGRLVATAGCNTISGPVTVTGDRIDAAGLSVTEKACDQQRDQQDRWLSGFLSGGPSWRLDGANLVLSSAGTDLVLTASTARPLVGTTWTADTLILGEPAGVTPAGVAATLVFGTGEAAVTGLCNLRTVRYTAEGSTITFELGPLTRKACAPEIMAVEQAAVALLDGETSYRIDAETLTITKGDKGLRFTATA